jgi:hypothetical protein
MSSLEWLQSWYRDQCNDEWEHHYGVTIESLDNPGWRISIDLTGTAVEGLSPRASSKGSINHHGLQGNHDWYECKIEDARFKGACGPELLDQMVGVFRGWVEEASVRAGLIKEDSAEA